MADPDAHMQKITEVQSKYVDELMRKPNVVGVAIGMCKKGGIQLQEACLVVMVERKLPEAQLRAEDIIPRELDGVRVDVQEMGFLSAQ